MSKYDLTYKFDKGLRDVPCSPSDVKLYIEELLGKLEIVQSAEETVKILGEAGPYSRLIGELDQADDLLTEAMVYIEKEQMPVNLWLVNSLRLAHVYQWQKRFELSDFMFEECLDACKTENSLQTYLHFALQHTGKNLFDQYDYESALKAFEEALEIRKKIGDETLIASTVYAISQTKISIKKFEATEFLMIDAEKEKSKICEEILRSLPKWFGIESAIVNYVKESKKFPMYAIQVKGAIIGFVSTKVHFKKSVEIYVMGLKEKCHGKNYGSWLLAFVEDDLSKQKFEFLTVKTLSENRVDKFYEKTRNFYLKNGFSPLEEFPALWGEANPCLQMIKTLNSNFIF